MSGNSPAVQWLGFGTSTAGVIPGWVTNILHAEWLGQENEGKNKKKASFSFDPHVFWWKTCCHWKSFSLRDKVFFFSCCFQDFFFTSNFRKFNYYMSWHRFLWVYLVWNVLSILNLQLYLSLAESGKFSAIISLSTFQPLPLSPLLRLMAWMLDLLL